MPTDTAAKPGPEDQARAEARRTGKRSRVDAKTTETSELFANPSGSLTLEETLGAPKRVKRGDDWVPVDTSLRRTGTGRWQPAATAMETSFSVGGTEPVLTMRGTDGRELSYTWPTALPAPRVEGAAATYPDVLPGVDLRLTAAPAGVEQDLVIKDRAAAANPALTNLKLAVRSDDGLALRADATGNVTATPAARATAEPPLTAPAPLLSDSTGGGPGQDDAPQGPDRSRTALGAAEVEGSTLALSVDTAFLRAAATQYPVHMSQQWAQGNRANWTRVYKRFPTTTYWNSTDPARIGYENETDGLSRSMFTMDAKNLKGVTVTKATFRAYETWSWSCQARPAELWQTGAISSGTHWNNQPAWMSKVGSANVAKGWGSDCPAGGVEFDVTPLVRSAAQGGWNDITLGLRASNESDTFAWKKFKNDPVLVTEYDRAPDTPTEPATDPVIACGRTEPFPKIGKVLAEKGVALKAKVSDPDGGDVTARFTFKKHGGANVATPENTVKSGSVAQARIGTELLKDGDTYAWNVQARDPEGVTSNTTADCVFGVDFTRPASPPQVSSAQYPENAAGAAARTPGVFAFTANGIADVESFQYSLNHDFTTGSKPATVKPDKPGGTAQAKLTPFKWSTNTLYVRSVDGAGNLSDTYKYVFKAAASHADPEGDMNGDGFSDVFTVGTDGRLSRHSNDGKGGFATPKTWGSGWLGGKLSHRGDWTGDGYEDLLALLPIDPKNLRVYPGDGLGEFQTTTTLPRPAGAPSPDWSQVTSFVSAGDVTWDTFPDLLAVEGDSLYLYPGTGDGKVDNPVKIGATGWTGTDLFAPGDADGDGVADLWLRTRDSGELFQVLNSADDPGNALGDPSRRVKIGEGLTATGYPQLGVDGDLTGDDHGDLWIQTANGRPAVIAGHSDPSAGTVFTGPYPRPSLGDAAQWKGVKLSTGGDFDGDGRADLLTVRTDGSIKIAVGTGTGWFGGEIPTQAPTALWAQHASVITAGDFTGDRKSDLIVRWSDGELSLYPGNGSGGFLKDIMLSAAGATWKNAVSLAAGDFTGDGRTDLVAARPTGVLALYPGNGTNGIGAEKQIAGTGSVWQHNTLLTAGDYNKDGKADLIARWVDGEVSFHPGNAAGGLGADVTLIAANAEWKDSMAIVGGDYTGDGKADLISLWNSGRLALQSGNGTGGLGATDNLVAP
ncbi:FG-GAP-like repeat-containing protein [Streptomyces sp. NBC_00237]|uniref:FG-GAP-like repeat-containing protein n=1 Tax=Streptomyces sp. NBC_00237 TaxID=2975687 RepID=UPI0022599173|nr:FG-GAP-like repeat-containing protein [Streptomyces sp. NBC_00237]MCX5205929.1 FG-GAP-like repeat-containing protein [Streptomyces sp. NBC_00237]